MKLTRDLVFSLAGKIGTYISDLLAEDPNGHVHPIVAPFNPNDVNVAADITVNTTMMQRSYVEVQGVTPILNALPEAAGRQIAFVNEDEPLRFNYSVSGPYPKTIYGWALFDPAGILLAVHELTSPITITGSDQVIDWFIPTFKIPWSIQK